MRGCGTFAELFGRGEGSHLQDIKASELRGTECKQVHRTASVRYLVHALHERHAISGRQELGSSVGQELPVAILEALGFDWIRVHQLEHDI